LRAASDALDVLDRALAEVGRSGGRWCEAELYRMRGEQGGLRRGRALQSVYDAFTEGFATPDLKDATALLAGLA